MVNDLEKRWTADEPTFRRAAKYVMSVIAVAALFFAVATIWAANRDACAATDTDLCDTPAKAAVLIGPTAVLMLGGIGAFVRTFQQWRNGKSWPIWQGAGWFLFVLMTVYLAIGGSSAAG